MWLRPATSIIAFLPDIMSQLFTSFLPHRFQFPQSLLVSSLQCFSHFEPPPLDDYYLWLTSLNLRSSRRQVSVLLRRLNWGRKSHFEHGPHYPQTGVLRWLRKKGLVSWAAAILSMLPSVDTTWPATSNPYFALSPHWTAPQTWNPSEISEDAPIGYPKLGLLFKYAFAYLWWYI